MRFLYRWYPADIADGTDGKTYSFTIAKNAL